MKDECSEALAEDEEIRCKQIKDVSTKLSGNHDNNITNKSKRRKRKKDGKKKNSHKMQINHVKTNGILKQRPVENKSTQSIKVSILQRNKCREPREFKKFRY